MDVYAVPTGVDRHELYCEAVDEAPAPEHDVPSGLAQRLGRRFREMIAAAEDHRQRPPHQASTGWAGRVGRGVMRQVAETVAEQRLLWHLRRQDRVALQYPDDLSEARALAILRGALARDRDRHRFWVVVDGLLAAITGPLFFFVPGPNLVAYYFVFRFVGHYLAWRGAQRGLDGVAWTTQPNALLTKIRSALALDAVERDRSVREIAERLHLHHLAPFVRRTAP